MATPVSKDNEWYVFACPHCGGQVQVHQNDVACKIFRHGSFFNTTPQGGILLTTQVPPHATKEQCDKWAAEGSIIGCGKPFTMDGATVQVCDYI